MKYLENISYLDPDYYDHESLLDKDLKKLSIKYMDDFLLYG